MNKLFLKIAKEVLKREIQDQEISTLILNKDIWQDILKYLKKIKNSEKTTIPQKARAQNVSLRRFSRTARKANERDAIYASRIVIGRWNGLPR